MFYYALKRKLYSGKCETQEMLWFYQRLGSLGVSMLPFNLSIPVRNPPGAYGVKNISL